MKFPKNVTALFALAALAACQDDIVAAPEALTPGLYAAIAVASVAGDTVQVTLGLTRVGMAEQVASAQGVLSFDAAQLTFVDGRSAEGVFGAANQTEAGRVRFAAAAVDGLNDDQPLAVLRFVAHGTVDAKALRVKLEEVTAARDFGDLTERVIERPTSNTVRGER